MRPIVYVDGSLPVSDEHGDKCVLASSKIAIGDHCVTLSSKFIIALMGRENARPVDSRNLTISELFIAQRGLSECRHNRGNQCEIPRRSW